MGQRTALYALHVGLGARMVDFGGWEMPLAYGSQIEEHHAVRRSAGVFDVSHMGIVDLAGIGAAAGLARLLANDVARLRQDGQALYSCMLNEHGGILDDLMVYRHGAQSFRLVVNAGTAGADLAWIGDQLQDFDVAVRPRTDLAMLAVQGPAARAHVAALLGDAGRAVLALAPFTAADCGAWRVARTGYTGEDGLEIMLPTEAAAALWGNLNARGVCACGLGARDTLRLEAGLNLYGADMDASTNPFESNLGWTVALQPAARKFVGREALQPAQAGGVARRLVGLALGEERAVMRSHQPVRLAGGGSGQVTSGTFSPTLGRSIALARVPAGADVSAEVQVRGRWLAARVIKPPFVRHGRALVDSGNAP